MRLPPITPRNYRRITLVTLFLVAIIVVTGAAVRLTGSGLGCADWPNCSQSEFVGVANSHQQIEQLNRLFTGVVSLAIALAVLGSLARVPRRRDLIRWSVGLVLGILANSVLGGITVLTHLSAPIVMGHFLLAIILIWNAVVLHDRAGHSGTPGTLTASARARNLGRVMVALAGAVLVTGTVVTGTGPHGGDETVARLPFVVEDVARIHSVTAWAFLAVALAFGVVLHRGGATGRALGRLRWLIVVVIAQGALGYTQYVLGVPPGLVGLHVAGAVAVWVATLMTYLGLFSYPAEIMDVDVSAPVTTTGDEHVTAAAR